MALIDNGRGSSALPEARLIPLGPGGRLVSIHECIYCNAVFDMPSAADERCREREKLVGNWGNPFRTDEPTH
jgi:hypothetical protein